MELPCGPAKMLRQGPHLLSADALADAHLLFDRSWPWRFYCRCQDTELGSGLQKTVGGWRSAEGLAQRRGLFCQQPTRSLSACGSELAEPLRTHSSRVLAVVISSRLSVEKEAPAALLA